MTIIETAKLNGLDPQAYLADILDRDTLRIEHFAGFEAPIGDDPYREGSRAPSGWSLHLSACRIVPAGFKT